MYIVMNMHTSHAYQMCNYNNDSLHHDLMCMILCGPAALVIDLSIRNMSAWCEHVHVHVHVTFGRREHFITQ